jgi:hypothetical protein
LRPEDESGKSHKLLSINVFKAQDVDFEWLNMAEIELSHLSRQCLGGRIAAKATLINKVQAWNTQRNEKHAKAHWQFTTDDARVKLSRLYDTVAAILHSI